MNNNKITFRVAEKQYNEIKKMADDNNVSVGEMARKLMLESAVKGRNQSVLQEKEKLSCAALRNIKYKLVLLEHEIEKLPDSQKQKNVLKEGVADIWLLLN